MTPAPPDLSTLASTLAEACLSEDDMPVANFFAHPSAAGGTGVRKTRKRRRRGGRVRMDRLVALPTIGKA